ncbi:MAG: hypothetical protein WD049_05995 [Candidatus Paceibacterota bacterium]
MKTTKSATMIPVAHDGRQLLVGRIRKQIRQGSWVILVRDGDTYQLLAARDDRSGPHASIALASFLAPEQLNEIERGAALEAVTPTKAKRKRTTRKAARRNERC